MCAASNTTEKPSNGSTKPSMDHNSKPKNKHSHGGKQNSMQKKSGSAQKPNHQSRNEKRARWAKKNRPVARPAVRRGPVNEYISACCNAPATKPRCGQKETVKDAESGKMKDTAKGLGKWRCSGCRKACKVQVRKPQPKVVVVDMAAVEQKVIAEVTNAPTA